jgi:DNA polymerase-3 subunit beta
MKLTIKKSDIVDVLSKLQGLAGRKTNLAITTNLLLRTSGSGIYIIATDLETGFQGFYPAKVDSEGEIAINARKFFEIVRDYPEDEIKLEESENRWIKIGNKKVEYNIVGMSPEDFPDIPVIEKIDSFNIDALEFNNMIEKTSIIMGASDDKRSHICGTYFEILKDENKVRMVSTDGSRLSLVDYINEGDISFKENISVILPKKGLLEVSKFLDKEGIISIGIKENNFILIKENEIIIMRLLEGSFPEYRDIIDKDKTSIAKLKKEKFLMMLKRMSILASENYRGVIFNFTKNKININSTNPDIGESKEDMDIEYEGNNIVAAFNPKYFIETINVIKEENVIVNLLNEEKPCFVEGEKDKNFLSVIMPMRI